MNSGLFQVLFWIRIESTPHLGLEITKFSGADVGPPAQDLSGVRGEIFSFPIGKISSRDFEPVSNNNFMAVESTWNK